MTQMPQMISKSSSGMLLGPRRVLERHGGLPGRAGDPGRERERTVTRDC